MMKYFFLSWKRYSNETPSAFSLQNVKSMHELIIELEGKHTMPFDFEIRNIKKTKKGLIVNDEFDNIQAIWLDYLPNILAWPIMSLKMKTIIDNHLNGDEGIDWISCNVYHKNISKIYFILRYNKILDVLDYNRTIFVKGTDHIIKPYFEISKINKYHIFNEPINNIMDKISPGIFISDILKKALNKEKITGASFEKIPI